MAFSTLPAYDATIIGAAVALANLPAGHETAQQVNVAIAGIANRARKGTATRWNPATDALMRWIRPDLAFLRAAFETLRAGGTPPIGKLRDYLDSVGGTVELRRTPAGHELIPIPELTGVASVVGYAVAALMDYRHGARARLGWCRECEYRAQQIEDLAERRGGWFFADRTGRGRFRTDFCSKTHNDAWAVRAMRARDKK